MNLSVASERTDNSGYALYGSESEDTVINKRERIENFTVDTGWLERSEISSDGSILVKQALLLYLQTR